VPPSARFIETIPLRVFAQSLFRKTRRASSPDLSPDPINVPAVPADRVPRNNRRIHQGLIEGLPIHAQAQTNRRKVKRSYGLAVFRQNMDNISFSLSQHTSGLTLGSAWTDAISAQRLWAFLGNDFL